MAGDSLPVLTKSRQYVRQRVTKLCSKIDAEPSPLTPNQRSIYSDRLRDLSLELRDLNKKVFSLATDDTVDESTVAQYIDDDDVYDEKISLYLSNLKTASIVPGDRNNDKVHHKLKLPEVPLPVFSSKKDESLKKFLRSFESIISKHNLSSYEKFIYLRSQLSGGPRVLIDSLDVDQQSYETAKTLLEQAFDCTLTAKYDLIQKLSCLRLPNNAEPYSFIGEMRTIVAGTESLKISVNDILQYFIWHALNDRFQSHIIAITNKSKPSLAEITDNIFEATERYIKQVGKQNECLGNKPRNECKSTKFSSFTDNKELATTTMAVDVKFDKKSKLCILCSRDGKCSDHYLRECTVYDTPRRKCDKLGNLKGCMKCSFVNHDTSQCRFKFPSNCRDCGGKHMTFLCLKSSNANSNDSFSSRKPRSQYGPVQEETNTNLSLVEVSHSSCVDAFVLPTITATITSNEMTEQVRAFKDGGCQRTFIGATVAEKLNLRVLSTNVPLTIHGFNSSKELITKTVNVPLLIDGVVFNIEAICIDKIKTKFNINNIGRVVRAFIDKGYRIADKCLNASSTGVVDDISLILGTDTDHILPLTYKLFGDSQPKSCFIDTHIGVIFSGNISRMMSNLKFLPINELRPGDRAANELPVVPFGRSSSLQTCSSLVGGGDAHVLCSELDSVSTLFSARSKDDSVAIADVETFSDTDCIDEIVKDVLNVTSETKKDLLLESETNVKLINYVLGNSERDASGSLIMPLTWNCKNAHLLSMNYTLSRKILDSNFKKLSKNADKLRMYDDVFQEQIKLGIIEKIEDVDQFIRTHPECSFLPHMGVFRMSHESTKCRVVFLSNLSEKRNNKHTVSHNQAILPGPSLNHKITTSVMLLRFDSYLITFDIKKAFLNIKLREGDQNRLMFLWYSSVGGSDYRVVGYRNLRLSFGLRCSPAILMLGLYKILILDRSDNRKLDNLKRDIYNTIYMDNGSYSCNNSDELTSSYHSLRDIFSPYNFELQQFYTNSSDLQSLIDEEVRAAAPVSVKLFGMIWNRNNDSLSPAKLQLNASANTKRDILKTLNSIYDVYSVYAPLLLRAKLFLQKLQLDRDLSWDTVLPVVLQREWSNITKQTNSSPLVELPRFVGERKSKFSLIAFTDASKDAYGVVVYIRDLNANTINYLLAKNRLLNSSLSRKTIPQLELQAVNFGVEVLLDTYQSLAGETVVNPVSIAAMDLFTDSMVCLHWLQSYSVYFSKLQRLSVFVMNRLRSIDELCRSNPVHFRHIAGNDNPSDNLTRHCSHRLLSRSNYYTGPSFLIENFEAHGSDFLITIPNPTVNAVDEVSNVCVPDLQTEFHAYNLQTLPLVNHFIPLEKYSSFSFMIGVYKRVLVFINNVKLKLKRRNIILPCCDNLNMHSLAMYKVISCEQKLIYPEVFKYLGSKNKTVADLPQLVSQLNLFKDEHELLRIRSKFSEESLWPILLPRDSLLTCMIVRDVHLRLSHSGVYPVLRELRKQFWITHYFSCVKNVLKKCIVCRKFNSGPIKLNQSAYRDFRVKPSSVPFSNIFVDYIGPFIVKLSGSRQKVWLLIITCLWSRAVNLKICLSANVQDFLRAIQLHIYEYGIFNFCVSDLGSQIQAGANLITTFLSDFETEQFFEISGIQKVKFRHYAKGNSSLGSIVEVCVKQVKHLLFKSIRTIILDFFDFSFIICKTINLINKRPIAFKESLRNLNFEALPIPITPEILMRGYETLAINIVPELQPAPIDPTYEPGDEVNIRIKDTVTNLCRVRERIVDIYHSEFLATLVTQAVDKKDRYKPVLHKVLAVGDIVLLVDKHTKRYHFPMGRVLDVIINSLGEVTAAHILKGNTRERVFRHVTSLILLISSEGFEVAKHTSNKDNEIVNSSSKRPIRSAAQTCRQKLQVLQAEQAI